MLFFRDILASFAPSLFYRAIFHCGFRSGLCLRCKCALSELKQRVFAHRTTKMLISDDFGVVYRIIDLVRPVTSIATDVSLGHEFTWAIVSKLIHLCAALTWPP
jgi:hypothetical protein